MKHYDPADIANIKLLIMSEDSANVYIGVKLAKNVLGMTAKDLKRLVTIKDVKELISPKTGYNHGYQLEAFGKKYYGRNSAYAAYNVFCNSAINDINKLIYDLD